MEKVVKHVLLGINCQVPTEAVLQRLTGSSDSSNPARAQTFPALSGIAAGDTVPAPTPPRSALPGDVQHPRSTAPQLGQLPATRAGGV